MYTRYLTRKEGCEDPPGRGAVRSGCDLFLRLVRSGSARTRRRHFENVHPFVKRGAFGRRGGNGFRGIGIGSGIGKQRRRGAPSSDVGARVRSSRAGGAGSGPVAQPRGHRPARPRYLVYCRDDVPGPHCRMTAHSVQPLRHLAVPSLLPVATRGSPVSRAREGAGAPLARRWHSGGHGPHAFSADQPGLGARGGRAARRVRRARRGRGRATRCRDRTHPMDSRGRDGVLAGVRSHLRDAIHAGPRRRPQPRPGFLASRTALVHDSVHALPRSPPDGPVVSTLRRVSLYPPG